jgi:hypothetical protein
LDVSGNARDARRNTVFDGRDTIAMNQERLSDAGRISAQWNISGGTALVGRKAQGAYCDQTLLSAKR